MKVIFLDIDGVMTSNALNEEIKSSTLTYPFSKSCVSALNEILTTNRVRIILTSSWRTVFDAEKQCIVFAENGVCQMPYGQTKDIRYESRSSEIQIYLKEKPNIEQYVILDDMLIEGFDDHFVWIDPSTGLTAAHVDKVQRILNR